MSLWLRTALYCLGIAFLGEVVVAPVIGFAGIAPDFAVIAVVTLALARGAFAATLGGCALGLVQDVANPSLLGLNALAQTVVGYACGRLRALLVHGQPLVEGTLVALAALSHDTICLLGQNGFGFSGFLRPLFIQALPSAVYSGLVGVPLLRLAALLNVLGRDD